MAKRSHITVVDGESSPVDNPEEILVEDHDTVGEETAEDTFLEDDWAQEDPLSGSKERVAPFTASLVIAGWTAFFLWAHGKDLLQGGTPQDWSSWIIDWSIPVLLVLAVWILLARTSTREALRYGAVARGLSEESALLERRLITVNRELSLAREFLGNQSRDLEYLGRSASEKISEHADRLQGLIRDNGHQVEAIAGTSTTALENMERLRGNLPVIANSAKDVSNQIGSVGRTAQDQLGALVVGFERLNEFGEASGRQVGSLMTRVDETLAAFTHRVAELETITAERFSVLSDSSEAIRSDLQAQEIEALSALRARSLALRSELADTHAEASEEEQRVLTAIRDRMHALREEAAQIAAVVREGEEVAIDSWGTQIDAMKTRIQEVISEIKTIDDNALESAKAKLRKLFDQAANVDATIAERNRVFENESLRRIETLTGAQDEIAVALGEKMAAIDSAIAERREAQREQIAALIAEGDELGERVDALGVTFSNVAAQGHEARETLAGGIDALAGQLRVSREVLDGTDQEIARLTDASVRLLELIRASAKQSSEELPQAMEASEERLAEIERRAVEIHTLLDHASASGETLTGGMDIIEERTRAVMEGFDVFQNDFDGSSRRQIETVEELRTGLSMLAKDSESFSDQVQGSLREAIAALEDKARTALAGIEDEQAGRIERIAETIGSRSAQEIDRALAEKTNNALAQLDAARNRSNHATHDMTQHLREQLGRLNELTVNLESRIAHARDKATDTIDGDFARRVALITESLNSNSIDIAKALSSEVTDTAWASYLRGDRGIFTRRAVRLLDSSEAREIAELYDSDNDFREHVNRYIHDFEAMLRTLLSTRDGNAVSVTLLSSDMGKLYVVLAQALERFRQ